MGDIGDELKELRQEHMDLLDTVIHKDKEIAELKTKVKSHARKGLELTLKLQAERIKSRSAANALESIFVNPTCNAEKERYMIENYPRLIRELKTLRVNELQLTNRNRELKADNAELEDTVNELRRG